MNKGLYTFPKRKLTADLFLATDLELRAGSTVLLNDLVCMTNSAAAPLPIAYKAPWSAAAYSLLPSGAAPDVLQGSVTQTNSATSSLYSAVGAFPDGSFVVISGQNGGTPAFGIYNADGSVKVALTTIESTTPSWHGCSVCILNSGEFVVAYLDNSGQPKFGRYSNSGALQGSLTVINSAGSAVGPAVAALADGGFVAAFRENTGNTSFKRYDSTGTNVGGLVVVEATTPNDVTCAGLPNGGFVVAYLTSGNLGKFGRYNASGVLQGSLVTFAASSSVYAAVASLPNGNFVVGTFTSSILVTKLYDGNNNLLSTTNTNTGSSNVLRMAASGFGEFAAFTGVNAGGTGPGIIRFSAAHVVLNQLRVESASLYSVNGVFRPDGQLVICYGLNGGVSKYARYTGASAVILGVAVESASSGNFFRVRPSGVNGFPTGMRLRSALTTLPVAFDHRTLGGIAGSVAGDSVYLRGF
jgi:hypothetical protein